MSLQAKGDGASDVVKLLKNDKKAREELSQFIASEIAQNRTEIKETEERTKMS